MPHVHEHVLPNGMTLLCCRQSQLHSIGFGLYFRGGPLFEDEQTQGISHLLEHLCFRGVGGLDRLTLNRCLDHMGAELEGSTMADAISFTTKVHPRFFDSALEVLLRFFVNIPWSQQEIDTAREIVKRQIEVENGDFEETVDLRMRGRDAFPVMGDPEALDALDADTIAAWQKRIFRPGNACLCVSGNFSSAMEDALCIAFGDLPDEGGEPFEQLTPPGFFCRDAASDYVEDISGDGPASVHLAFDVDQELVFPLVGEVLNAMTGADNDSLLFSSLREEYAQLADIESEMEDTGLFRRLVIRYDVPQERLEKSLEDVFSLLHRMSMYVRAARLDETRVQFTTNLAFLDDDVEEMNALMGASFLCGDLMRCDLEARASMYNDIDIEDLLNAAQTIFRPENLVISLQRDPALCLPDPASFLKKLRAMLE